MLIVISTTTNINKSIHSAVTTSSAGTRTTACTTGAVTNPKTKDKPTSKANPKPTTVGNQEPSFTTLTESLKPKHWHLVKKRGIIPDGLVQTRLNHCRKLTNGSRGERDIIQTNFCSTNERAGKRKGGNLDSPSAVRHRRDKELEPKSDL